MLIESIEIKNFKSLQNVKLSNLPGMAVFVGRNGVGKTVLFDVFGFLNDAYISDVKIALQVRGGFREVISRNQSGEILFRLKFRPQKDEPISAYELSIGLNENSVPVVKSEILILRLASSGQPWRVLEFHEGRGFAAEGELTDYASAKEAQRKQRSLSSPHILAVKALGNMADFIAVSKFCRLIEDWFVSDFIIEDARETRKVDGGEHLSRTGNNLASVARHMFENYPERFSSVVRLLTEMVPGVGDVIPIITDDGRILLRFRDSNFIDPFVSSCVSDGTIKMFTYLLLLNDPERHALLCVEEPESNLFPKLLGGLVEEFRRYSISDDNYGQVFISTHSPDLLDAVRLDELYCLVRGSDGYTAILRAADDSQINEFVKGGDLLGYLWSHDMLINME
ncbi:MAG: AAA family ATPase [Deltaproteobacteria bacterium]|jgi:predicted ATPase|nr:AAA family ATPase [Deltaproteobacteria bacterium]